MNAHERIVVASVLLLIAGMVLLDLSTDAREGTVLWHLSAEGLIALISLFGVFYILRGSFELKHDLQIQREASSNLQKAADEWQSRTQAYFRGLSTSIEEQLAEWKLSSAEKEVAFLLLKGMSLKEIAYTRGTTEKTARAQSIAIYSKAGLAGRSELAAFFLKELLPPEATTSGFPELA